MFSWLHANPWNHGRPAGKKAPLSLNYKNPIETIVYEQPITMTAGCIGKFAIRYAITFAIRIQAYAHPIRPAL
jgi:hypothetical protein